MKLVTEKGKRGELSINVMIMAIIALVVLIVIIAVFTGKLGIVSTSLNSCAEKGGTCHTKESCVDVGNDYAPMPSSSCPKKDDKEQVCCIKASLEPEEESDTNE